MDGISAVTLPNPTRDSDPPAGAPSPSGAHPSEQSGPRLFRTAADLAALDWRSLLDAARAEGCAQVRVWVAGWEGDAEPYVIALAASEALGPYAGALAILATDPDPARVALAAEGRFPAGDLDEIPLLLRDRYFDAAAGRLTARPGLHQAIEFAPHDLTGSAGPPAAGPFDVISCRCGLEECGADVVERVLTTMERALRPEGALVLGPRSTEAMGERRVRPRRPRELARTLRRALGLAEGRQPRAVPIVDPAEGPRSRLDDRVEHALIAMEAGDHASALKIANGVLEADALHADAHLVRGIALLESGDAPGAVHALRRATFVDPAFGLAFFELGRAHEVAGEQPEARHAFERALAFLGAEAESHEILRGYVDAAEVREACEARLRDPLEPV